MSNNQLYIDIEDCVFAYLDESEQNKSSRFYKCWQLANRGAENMGLDVFYPTKKAKIELNANQTFNVPEDYLRYYSLTLYDSYGTRVAFASNKSAFNSTVFGEVIIATNNDFNADDITLKDDDSVGLVSGSALSSSGYIEMWYKAVPSQDESVKIPLVFKEATIAYVTWKDLPKKMKGSNAWVTLRADFFNERRRAIAKFLPFYLEEMLYKINVFSPSTV